MILGSKLRCTTETYQPVARRAPAWHGMHWIEQSLSCRNAYVCTYVDAVMEQSLASTIQAANAALDPKPCRWCGHVATFAFGIIKGTKRFGNLQVTAEEGFRMDVTHLF